MFEHRRAQRHKWVAAAAAALAGAITLSGCGGGGGGLTPSPTNDTTTPSTPVTLVVPTSQAPWNPAYAKLVEAYQAETGNKVDLREFPNPDVKTQQVNDIQAQQHTFDVFQINEGDLVQFNENGWIQNLNEIDPGYEPDSAILSYSNISRWNNELKLFASDGVLTSAPLLGNVDIFYYRKDIYAQLGLQVPTTWDQVIDNGKKIVEAGAAKYGGVFRTQGVPGTYAATYEFNALLNSAGGAWFSDPGTDWTPTAGSAAGVQAATWFRELAKLGPEATSTIGQAQAIAAIQAGDAAQTYLVAAAAAQFEDESNSAVVGKIGHAPLPRTPEGKSSSATGLWVLGVPTGLPEERAKAALDYIKWMTSEKAMTLFAQYGGIPTRSDAFAPAGITEAAQAALDAVKETAENLPDRPTSLRYSFSTDILNVTEPELQNIAAGSATPQEGMESIQTGLDEIIVRLGLPKK